MAAEEMAEDCWRSKELGYKVSADERSYKTGFADGLKVGRPQWHKVTDDLPDNERYVWTNKGPSYYDNDCQCWRDEFGRDYGVIAWCEPKYEE